MGIVNHLGLIVVIYFILRFLNPSLPFFVSLGLIAALLFLAAIVVMIKKILSNPDLELKGTGCLLCLQRHLH